MVSADTLKFMTMLGKVTTGVNMASLSLFALVTMFTAVLYKQNDDDGPSVTSLRMSLVPLALVMAYAAWFVSNMVFKDSSLASLVGFAVFLRAIVLGF